MFRVTVIQGNEQINIPDLSWEHREFPSRITGRKAIYSEPIEFHMGADAWKLALWDDNRIATESHPKLAEANRDGGFLVPSNFQPWSFDGDLLSLPTWGAHHFTYHVSKKLLEKSHIEGLVNTLLWSPTSKKYFVCVHRYTPTRTRLCFLVDIESNQTIQLNIGLLEDESGKFWWLKDGTALLAVYRSSKQTHPVVELFNSQTGHSLGKASVDPNSLVPYDEGKYRNISRDHFSLEVSSSTWCVGYFLDTWHGHAFDNETNQLSLAVYRPAGEPAMRRNQLVLPVAEHRCKLQLEF